MTLIYAVVGTGIIACSIYMILSRNFVRMLLGLSMLATGTNLLLFLAGRLRSEQPPIIADGAIALTDSADPLAQALVLTAIVIGFALTVMLGALILRAWHAGHTVDARNVDASEKLGPPQARTPEDG